MSRKAPFTSDPILQMNSLAPALEVRDWVRGEPLASFQPGRVYILEILCNLVWILCGGDAHPDRAAGDLQGQWS
ncbi:hypothetical protein JOH52_007193 [Sinorhizobium meliloti]|nr:hypothetical protein [Sinorhizobium meliloti]